VLRKKVVKISAKVAARARYTMFQTAEAAVPQHLFRGFVDLIDRLRPYNVAQC
jgi:hypothetical protein